MTFVTTASLMSNPETGQPVVDYSSRDYQSIYQDLLDRRSTYMPEWTSQSNNDFGIVLLQMFAYVGDILGYYLDRIAGEAFMQTATQPQSILNLAQLLDYQPTQMVGAQVTLQITISSTINGPITIPTGTQFSTVGTRTQVPIVFQTTAPLTIAGENATTPQTIGTVAATQGVTISDEQVGTSDGTINQSFQLLQNPIEASPTGMGPDLQLYVDLGQGPTQWTYSSHLIDNGPLDHVFTIFTAPNNVMYIVFGDNVNGYVPPLGSPITATYVVGMGAQGNVGAGTIMQAMTAIPGVTAVTNPSAANGGADPESLASIQQAAPAALKALDRAVTVEDFATLALQTSKSVQWAAAIEMTYQLVNLYIAPTAGGPPSSTLVQQVLGYLAPRQMANTTVTPLPPTYVDVNITVEVVVFPNYGNITVQNAVVSALTNLFAQSQTGFGFRVSVGLVYQTILAVPGVNYAFVTSMYRQVLATTTAVLTNGDAYTALSVSALPRAVNAGDSIVINPGGTSTQTVVVASGGAAAGATSIPVTSFNANATYPSGTAIQDPTGINDAVMLANEIPVAGTFIITSSGGISGS